MFNQYANIPCILFNRLNKTRIFTTASFKDLIAPRTTVPRGTVFPVRGFWGREDPVLHLVMLSEVETSFSSRARRTRLPCPYGTGDIDKPRKDNANNKGQTHRSAPTITRETTTPNRRCGPMCPPKAHREQRDVSHAVDMTSTAPYERQCQTLLLAAAELDI